MLPNDLIFTPYANFPKKNQTELGYQLSYYSISAKTNDKGIYFSHSFSQNIRYGMEFYESSQTNHLFHHFAYRLGQIFPNSNYHFMFAGGFNYLSNTPQVLKNKYLHEGSLTTTWMPVHSPINISLTLSKKRFKNEFIGMANIAYHQAWGTLALEWDDVYLNLSSQFDIKKRFKFRAGITKNLQSATEIVFKTGVGLVDFDHSFTSPTKNFESAPPPVSTVNASVGLIHLQEGMQFYYNGEFKQAKKSYELAVKFFPHSAIVRERLGSIYYKLNEFEKAQIEWTKANAISPSSRLERYILEAREKGEGLNQ
jgi:tetratricopeptide (TPR) repeat protein